MADKSNKDIAREEAINIENALTSIAFNLGNAFKKSIDQATSGMNTSMLSIASKDFLRTLESASKSSSELLSNQEKLRKGTLDTATIEKQLNILAQQKLDLSRKFFYTSNLAKRVGVELTEEEKKQYTQIKYILAGKEAMLRQDELALKSIEKTTGFTGKILESLNRMPFLGKFLDTKEINQEMRKAAAAGEGSFKTRAIAVSMIGKQMLSGLTSAEFIIGKIFDTYLEINKASVDLQRYTGQNAANQAALNTGYASARDYLELSLELTKKTGMNAQNIFSQDVLSEAAELKTTMGLTAEQAGGLAMYAQLSGKSVDSISKSIVKTTSGFNASNRSAISQGQILRDVATTADSIKLSLGNNPESIAKAASAARRLGLELSDVDKISDSLVDFQSSISNELEAELLIGKNLNLDRARSLALNNDLLGVSNELFKNSSDIYEFSKLNRIQQDSYAKALGLTKEQLARIAYQKGIEAHMTAKQAADAAGVREEDMKRLDIQQNFALALEKIAGAVTPVLDTVGKLLSIPLVPHLLLGLVAINGIFGGLKGAVGLMGTLASGAGKLASNLFSGKAGVGSVAEAVVSNMPDKGIKAVGSVADVATKSKGVDVGAGARVSGFLSGLGAGFVSFAEAMATPTPIGPVGLVMAVSLGVITASIWGLGQAFGAAAPGIEAFGTVIKSTFSGISEVFSVMSMDNIGPIMLLGPALFGIASGLAAIGVTGLTALPAIAGLTALALASPKLITLGEKGSNESVGASKEKADEGTLSMVVAKLDSLIAVVKQGGDVFLDSNKVGRAQVLGVYKTN